MTILQLDSYPIEQQPDLDALESRNGQWFADRTFPMRLVGYSRRCDLAPAKAQVQHQLRPRLDLARTVAPLLDAIAAYCQGDAAPHPATVITALPAEGRARLDRAFAQSPLLHRALAQHPGADTAAWAAVAAALAALLWPLPWLNETLRFYDALEADFLRGADYYVLTWEPPSVSARGLASTLRHATGRDVRLVDQLPSIIRCAYVPRETYLEPQQPGEPYLAALLAYDMRGEMHARTLHTIMGMPFDVAIAVDIVTIPRGRAMAQAEWAQRAAEAVLRDGNLTDPASARRQADAEFVQHQLPYQGFHEVQIAVLVSGATREALEANLEEVTGRLGSQFSLTRVTSALVQHDLLKLWSPTAARQLNIPWRRRNMLSKGLGCCMGLLGYHRIANTTGIFWGIDSLRLAPLFVDLFAHNQAAHQIILGETGYGKTVFLNTLAIRAAAAGYRVISIDAFRNGDRVEAAVQAGARCYAIGLDTPINPLDVVTADEAGDAPGSWLPKQVQTVSYALGLLLGNPTLDADGRDQHIPRQFSVPERGVLDRALTDLYTARGIDPDTPAVQTPILSDLIDQLEQQHEPEAHLLARDLRLLIFGTADPSWRTMNSLGRSFNAHSQVDWRFELDITCYDLSRVPDNWKALYYMQAIGAVRRWMRDPGRDRRRPTLVQLDEFGYAAQVRAVLQLAVEICKTARKYRVGIMLIDQNPVTFLSDDGRKLIENAAATILFHLKDRPAQDMAQALKILTPEHVQFITGARPGECVAVIRQDAYPVSIQLNPKETRALVGS